MDVGACIEHPPGEFEYESCMFQKPDRSYTGRHNGCDSYRSARPSAESLQVWGREQKWQNRKGENGQHGQLLQLCIIVHSGPRLSPITQYEDRVYGRPRIEGCQNLVTR